MMAWELVGHFCMSFPFNLLQIGEGTISLVLDLAGFSTIVLTPQLNVYWV